MTSNWQPATLIESRDVAEGVKSLLFKVEPWTRHESGQHYSIRLTAEDGYQAQRDYSVASAPEQAGVVEFGVEKLEDGEVSPYLHTLKPGDQVEVRGPLGGHFVWRSSMAGPLLLAGGGSGIVPLMSMLRHHIRAAEKDRQREVVFLISAKTEKHILYYNELKEYAKNYPNIKLFFTLTRQAPAGWQGYNRRVDKKMLAEIFSIYNNMMAKTYLCGPTTFVESAAENLVTLGFHPHEILTERFG